MGTVRVIDRSRWEDLEVEFAHLDFRLPPDLVSPSEFGDRSVPETDHHEHAVGSPEAHTKLCHDKKHYNWTRGTPVARGASRYVIHERSRSADSKARALQDSGQLRWCSRFLVASAVCLGISLCVAAMTLFNDKWMATFAFLGLTIAAQVIPSGCRKWAAWSGGR